MNRNLLCRIVNIFLLSFLIFISACEVDRSTIGSVDQQQYSYNYISDFEFEFNRYFFIDTYYVERYEKGFSEDLQYWTYEPSSLIKELNVYKSAGYSNNDARIGVATIPSNLEEFYNLSDLHGIIKKSGEIELGKFVPLKEGKDYWCNYGFGYFYLNYPKRIKDTEILAVAYRTDNDTVGTLVSMMIDKPQPLVLRLVKSQAMRVSHIHIWPLMMRNVYSLCDTSIVRDGFNIKIRKKDNHSTIQEIEPRKRFTHLLGLDVVDSNGNITNNGDGQVDDNYNLLDLDKGVLIFPGLNPFNPLPESRFQLADINRVGIYDFNQWPNNPPGIDSSKFEIVVQYIKR